MAKTYKCLNCGTECEVTHSKRNKYCSTDCQHIHKWNTVTKPRLRAGGGSKTSTATLRKFLREECGPVCQLCGQGEMWNGKPLTLQVDHIDGNSDNNNVNNLRLVCPNCHTQTETWGSRGQGNRYRKSSRRREHHKTFLEKQQLRNSVG